MADIMLHNGGLSQVTCVCNTFIDEYMGEANGEYVKIYLYLLRCFNKSDLCLSLSDIADKLDHTEKDVVRALKYWAKKDLVRLEYDDQKEIIGISILDPQGHDALSTPVTRENVPGAMPHAQNVSSVVPTQIMSSVIPHAQSTPSYSAAQRDEFTNDPAIRELLFLAQTYLCHPLTHTETDYILSWNQDLGMKTDLISFLIEHCIENGHKSIHYMNSVAIAWTKEGICTVDDAISNTRRYSDCHLAVIKAFGISGRNLVPNEVEFVDKWSKKYGFSTEIIVEACSRTVMQTSKPNFKYADSILTSWHDNNISSLDEIREHDTKFLAASTSRLGNVKKTTKNSFNSFAQRDVDYEALEKQLISNK